MGERTPSPTLLLSGSSGGLSDLHEGGMDLLAEALDEGRVDAALFCHLSSRWYAGELFCHAAWIESLAAAGLKVSVCTKDSYLELFSRHPAVQHLYPAESFTPELAAAYPLVVFGATHPPEAFAGGIEHGIYSWNKGLAYAHRGRVMQRLERSTVNHFRSSRPFAAHLPLPDGRYLGIHLGDDELAEAERWLDRLGLERDRGIIVLNPSASNPVTRRSERPKAVDNELCVEDYSTLIGALRSSFPAQAILVGSPVLATDETNHALVRELCAEAAAPDSVISLLGDRATRPEIGFREFAALLAEDRVRGMVGNSTGTNAHLAAAIGLPALSIERAVDPSIRDNWSRPERGQMGSVAWRNPEPRMAAYTLSWQHHDDADFAHIARCFRLHLWAEEGRWDKLFDDPDRAAHQAKGCLHPAQLSAHFENRRAMAAWLAELARLRDGLSSPDAIAFYFDLSEEAAFLRARRKDEAAILVEAIDALRAPGAGAQPLAWPPPDEDRAVLDELLRDSNLFKLLSTLARSTEPG